MKKEYCNLDEYILDNFETTTINTKEEYEKFIIEEMLNDKEIYYRGFDNIRNLIPTLHRELVENSNYNKNFVSDKTPKIEDYLHPNINMKSAKEVEYKILKDMINNCSLFSKETNLIDLLATSQHYGVPTRCMDWTNLFVSLFFSIGTDKGKSKKNEYFYILRTTRDENIVFEDFPFIRENIKDTDGTLKYPNTYPLYIQAYYQFEQINSFLPYINNYTENAIKNNPKLKEKETTSKLYLEKVLKILYPEKNDNSIKKEANKYWKNIQKGKIIFLKPNFNNSRIASQSGLFSISRSLDANDVYKQLSRNCTVIRINSGLISLIENTLRSAGINSYKLIPDLSQACCTIKSKHFKK